MYFQATVRIQNRGESREVWFVIETEQETLRAVYEELVKNSAIYGVRVETKPSGEGRRVVDEYETILHRDSIASISELQFDLYDRDGDALFIVSDRFEPEPRAAAGGGR